jgi:DNA polymerase-3 subunit delta'
VARLIDQIPHQKKVWDRLMSARQENRLAHALAFSGPEGSGKKKMAWAFAQALLCDRQENAPCGECGPCRRVEMGSSESVCFIEPEKNTIKLEAAAEILDFLSLQRLSRARIVIADQAHLLNAQTANALLKAIEEPPPESYFILTTPGTSQLLPTLRSRVQNMAFQPAERAINEDARAVRELALKFLNAAAQRSRSGLEEVQAEGKDKETALAFTRELQSILRDWTTLESGSLIDPNIKTTLMILPKVDIARRVQLWQQAHKAEQDLLGNIDRALIFENFFYRARETFG